MIEAVKEEMQSPLSFGQQSLWFIQMMNPASTAYNIGRAVRLGGDADGPALRRTLQNLVARHASLRANFYAVQGKPFQRLSDRVEVPFAEVDASSWNDEQLQARLAEEVDRPFDLERDPLLRATLFRRVRRDDVLLLVAHQIVCDSWTMTKLISELTGASPDKPALEHTDFVRRQLEMVDEQTDWDYWQKQLSGELPALNLPTTYSRPPFKTYRGSSYSFTIDDRLMNDLKVLSRDHAATLYMTLFAAFNVLLHRYTEQDDILIGTPASDRNRREFSDVMGYLVNPLVLRTDLSGDPVFSELLERVRQTVLDAAEHQAYPFARLVKRLQPTRDPSRSPLFDVMFVFENLYEAQLVPIEHRTAQFDLTLVIEGSRGEINYNTDLFDEPSIVRLATHYMNLLRGVVMQPDAKLHRLPLLSDEERREVFEDFNAALPLRRTTDTLHQLFEEQAALTPANVAVVADKQQLSYEELNDRAEQVAARLRLLEVGPEVRVGVLLRRSPALLVSMLGVLKAGGAYVPLDPDYPPQRVQFMLADSGSRVLISDRKLLEEWSDALPAGVVVLAIEDVYESEPIKHETRVCTATPENLAYVIYTSGSTGVPKGVMITHRSATALVEWALDTYTPDQLAGVLAATSVCFDLSIFEIFVPLSCGGTVVLAENALEWPAGVENRVTLINTVPSVMAEFLRSRGETLPRGVRVVNLAGEALPRSLVDTLYGFQQIEQVWNLYGPSEDTTYSTAALIRRDETTAPPIGRPVSGTRAYILDSHLEPVPVGVVGQLCLGSAGLARGYLERPQLTAECFVPDAQSASPGARMYLTGDLARYLPSGEIEYLGRRDQQVKVRGFRIEFGEIEAVVRRHEAIAEAVVVARDDVNGRRLICYYMAVHEVNKGELRRWIRERLPEHMVPATYVKLESLPLTPSGKVDRRSLPDIETEGQRARELPADEIEEIIAEVWAEVLGVEPVGIRENFFALGGHSLLVTQIICKLRDVTGYEISLRTFFSNPTVAELAALIKEQLGTRKTKAARIEAGNYGNATRVANVWSATYG